MLAVASLRRSGRSRRQTGGGDSTRSTSSTAAAGSSPTPTRAGPWRVDLSSVEIVRRFIEQSGAGAGARRDHAAASTARSAPAGHPDVVTRCSAPSCRVPDDSGWGVIVQVDTRPGLLRRHRDAQAQSLVLVGVVTALAVVLGHAVRRADQPAHPAARRRRAAPGRRRLRDPGVGEERKRGRRARRRLQPDGGARSRRPSRRSAGGGRRTRSSSWAPSACWPTPSTRRTPTPAATPSAWPTTPHASPSTWGCRTEEVERVHLSGIIHDVGKIGIEDKILRKAAALTDDEYEIMKQHPTKGAHILEAVPLLKEMAGAGLMHHENVDGSGYPDGPQGRGDPAPRAHRERGRRLRRHDHRPALLEGDDLRGGHRPTAVPGRQEVRRRLRRGLRAGLRGGRRQPGQGAPGLGGGSPAGTSAVKPLRSAKRRRRPTP